MHSQGVICPLAIGAEAQTHGNRVKPDKRCTGVITCTFIGPRHISYTCLGGLLSDICLLGNIVTGSFVLQALCCRGTPHGRSKRAWTRRSRLGTQAMHDAWRRRTSAMFPVGIWAAELRCIKRPLSIDKMMKGYEGTEDSASTQ